MVQKPACFKTENDNIRDIAPRIGVFRSDREREGEVETRS